MYSKKSGRGSLPPRMPEHYNGWAFQPPSPPKDRPPKFDENEGTRPVPPPPKPEIHQSYPRPLPFLPPPPVPAPPEKPAPPLPPALEHLLGKSGFLHSLNLNFEELLLIGLIILLGSSGEDGELPLLLALLLLC